MSRLLPKNVALTDQILEALADGPGTAREIAERAGTTGCYCLAEGTPGVYHDKRCQWCVGYPGWRPLMHADVRPILERLARRGDASKVKDVCGAVLYLPVVKVGSER